MKFLMMLLSVYRITYMVVNEIGPLAIFERFRTYISNNAYGESAVLDEDNQFWQNIDEGINCEYCVSVWISGLVWLIGRIPVVNKMFLGMFGLAGAWMLLQEILDRLESTND